MVRCGVRLSHRRGVTRSEAADSFGSRFSFAAEYIEYILEDIFMEKSFTPTTAQRHAGS
ncbi:MAG: hypothetical protein M3014_03875 [Chloroflexota bacterium]|nr:hypothetical protein [Chloroflexota bacterium]